MLIHDNGLGDRLILSAVGTIQGIAIWLLLDIGADKLTSAGLAAALTFILVSGAIAHFVWTGNQNLRLVIIAAAVGVAYAVIAFWVAAQIPSDSEAEILARGDQRRIGTWLFASLFSLYVLAPFLQIYQRTSRANFPYTELFVYSWSNFHIALVGLLFVGVLWGVLGLWAVLFRLLDIDFFAELFTKELFIWSMTGGAIGFGLSLGREKEKLIATLRSITLSVFRALLPLVAMVALLFVIVIPFAGLKTLWETRAASWILLSWIACTLLFINAVYQNGRERPPYARWIRRGVEGGLLAMIVFVALALFGLLLRVDQYGLTPARFTGLIVTGIFIAYVVGYSVSVVRRRDEWLSSIKTVNLWMAPVLVSVALLTHTPILDPLGISAANQYDRLVSGKADADSFDYQYMRFKLGSAGQAKLEALKNLPDGPRSNVILAGVAAAESVKRYKQVPARKLVDTDFELLPTGMEWPPGLLAAVRGTMPGHISDVAGSSADPVRVLAIELDERPGLEFVVFAPTLRNEAQALKADGKGGWVRFGTYRLTTGYRSIEQIGKALQSGDYAAAPAEYRDLRIGDQSFYLAPN